MAKRAGYQGTLAGIEIFLRKAPGGSARRLPNGNFHFDLGTLAADRYSVDQIAGLNDALVTGGREPQHQLADEPILIVPANNTSPTTLRPPIIEFQTPGASEFGPIRRKRRPLARAVAQDEPFDYASLLKHLATLRYDF